MPVNLCTVTGCPFNGKYCRLHQNIGKTSNGGTKEAKGAPVTKKASKPPQKSKPPVKQPAKPRKAIAKASKKRAAINRNQYGPKSKEYLARPENQKCNIKAPGVCKVHSKVINHTIGKDSIEDLLNEKFWEPSCVPCNNWIEANHDWARERGHKKSKHTKEHATRRNKTSNPTGEFA